MPELIRLLLMFTFVLIACVGFARNVFAQPTYQLPTPAGIIPTQVLGPYSPLPQSQYPPLPTSTGVSTSASTVVPVTLPGGKTVPVPLTATAQVSRAAIAKAVAKLVPIVSTAMAVKELIDLLSPLGYQLNPNGVLQAPERPAIPGDPAGTGYTYVHFGTAPIQSPYFGKTPVEACEKLADDFRTPNWSAWVAVATVDSAYRCTVRLDLKVCTTGMCTPQYAATNRDLLKFEKYYSVAPAPLSEVQIEQDAIAKMAEDPTAQTRLYDALQKDWRNKPNLPSVVNPISPTTPITINAPPVNTIERTIRTETRRLPDGSTETITTKESTKIVPVTTGSTYSDIKTTYQYENSTTTSTTNNVTNITTINTAVDQGEVSPPLPKDESKEDPCSMNPDRAECADIGTPPPAETLPQIDVPFSFAPMLFTSVANCPAPIIFNAFGPREISYQPMCNVMVQMRPVFLTCAALATALIFLMGIRRL